MKVRKNISDNIYEQIKEDLLSGQLHFGESISEIEYSEQHNVSRTPLREAVKKLEIEGIIERLPNGRLKIIEITEERIIEIFEIRIALENIILNSIAGNLEIIQKLQENLNLTKFYLSEENFSEVKKLFSQFNKLLYEASSLDFTVKIIKQYDFLISKLRKDSLENTKRILQAYNEHIEILELIKQGDIENLKKLNQEHLLKSKSSILKFFKSKKIESK